MRRTKDDADKTRQALIDAALELFADNGYESTTISAIAQAAGVTRGAFYWHFQDKAELLNALSEIYFGNFTDIDNGGERTWADIEAHLIAYLQDLSENEDHRRFICIVYQEANHPDCRAMYEKYVAVWRDNFYRTIAKHSETSRNNIDPQWAFWQFHATMNGLVGLYADCPNDDSIYTYGPDIIRSTLAMIENNCHIKYGKVTP